MPMALTECLSRMNVEANKTVHPFFTKPKEAHHSVAQDGPESHESTDKENNSISGNTPRLDVDVTQQTTLSGEAEADRIARKRAQAEDLNEHFAGHDRSAIATSQTTAHHSQPQVSVVIPFKQVRSSDEETAEATTQASRSHKLLKLNANGTLCSPTKAATAPAEPSASIPQSSPSKRKAKRSSKARTSIIVLRYATQTTRARIAEILTSKSSSQVKTELTRSVPAVVRGPPKPLHPFFSKDKATKLDGAFSKITTVAQPKDSHEASEAPASSQTNDASVHIAPALRASRPLTKTKSSKDAPWPWNGVVHVHPENDSGDSMAHNSTMHISSRRKAKGTLSHVTQAESILNACRTDTKSTSAEHRVPARSLLTWQDIQARQMKTVSTQRNAQRLDAGQEINMSACHAATMEVISQTKHYLSDWDSYRCSSTTWLQKYAPTSALHVLQDGKEAVILRDWLVLLQVNNTDSGKSTKLPSNDRAVPTTSQKKRKRNNEMDDFIVDEDEEIPDWTDIEDAPSRTRPPFLSSRRRRPNPSTSRPPNTILLSGPSGCGKTAAVYAVAKELGFEVFEINAGSRRSAKDIMDRIGDMMENHLVQQVANAVKASEKAKMGATAAPVTPSATPSGDNERQGNMNPFFKSSMPVVDAGSKRQSAKTKSSNSSLSAMPVAKQQKQSLILFEEADILFAEDKNFWQAVIALTEHSKRPVVFTCKDESLIPSQALPLHAILRFVPPSEEIACNHLAAIANREGHLIAKEAIQSLYLSTNFDLRASLTSLDFWCQMAVGSTRGGLDWMIDRYPKGNGTAANGYPFRAISHDTYLTGHGLLNHDEEITDDATDYLSSAKQKVLAGQLHDLNLSLTDLTDSHDMMAAPYISKLSLTTLDTICESFSALDVSCTRSMRFGLRANLDPEHPPFVAKRQLDNVSLNAYILSELHIDHSNFDAEMTAAVVTSVEALAAQHSEVLKQASSCNAGQRSNRVLSMVHRRAALKSFGMVPQLRRFDFSVALDIFAEDECTDASILSSFDRAFNVIALDLAPYIREIASHDMSIDRDNAALLPSSQKRVRLSRVSRSAADGGRREDKRQQKHFDNSVNLQAIMNTGGRKWYRGKVEDVLPDLPGCVKPPFAGANMYQSGVLGTRYLDDMVRNW